MKTTRRRFWVYFLLLVFGGIAYVDRVNMSVAGKPIAHELGLSPVMLGYLFSSFLWAYVAHDAAGRPVDRPLGRACGRVRGDRGVVGGTDGDRCRRGLRVDAVGAAWVSVSARRRSRR